MYLYVKAYNIWKCNTIYFNTIYFTYQPERIKLHHPLLYILCDQQRLLTSFSYSFYQKSLRNMIVNLFKIFQNLNVTLLCPTTQDQM